MKVTSLVAAALAAMLNVPLSAQLVAGADVAAANQTQYEIDRQAYVAALTQQQRAINRADARFARQQTAYADAMAVWRVQVDQCKKGRQKACDLPSPNPADYY